MAGRSTDSSSQALSTRGESGTYVVCRATFKLVPASGVVRKHGHGHGRPQCPGYGCLPESKQASDLHSSVDLFNSSMAGPADCIHENGRLDAGFIFPIPQKPTLRKIPHGVRQKAALAF